MDASYHGNPSCPCSPETSRGERPATPLQHALWRDGQMALNVLDGKSLNVRALLVLNGEGLALSAGWRMSRHRLGWNGLYRTPLPEDPTGMAGHRGDLWVGGSQGLAHYDGKEWTTVLGEVGVPLALAPGGAVWLSTPGRPGADPRW